MSFEGRQINNADSCALAFSDAESQDELRQALLECPAIASEAFTLSVENLVEESSDPAVRRALRKRLSRIYAMRRKSAAS